MLWRGWEYNWRVALRKDTSDILKIFQETKNTTKNKFLHWKNKTTITNLLPRYVHQCQFKVWKFVLKNIIKFLENGGRFFFRSRWFKLLFLNKSKRKIDLYVGSFSDFLNQSPHFGQNGACVSQWCEFRDLLMLKKIELLKTKNWILNHKLVRLLSSTECGRFGQLIAYQCTCNQYLQLA